MKKIIISILLIFSGNISAQNNPELPPNCKPIKIANGTKLSIEYKDPMVLYIYKKKHEQQVGADQSNSKFWLIDPINQSQKSLSIELLDDTWSLLFLTPGQHEFVCLLTMPGHERQIICKKEIIVCEYKPSEKWDGVPDKKHSTWVLRSSRNNIINNMVNNMIIEENTNK